MVVAISFGLVVPLLRSATEAEEVQAVDDIDFGLASYFYRRDHARVWRVSEALGYEMVDVNIGPISTTEASFGGVKESGHGSEGTRNSLYDFLELKYICMGGIDAMLEV